PPDCPSSPFASS
ncbi:hypothetical protein J1605_010617, partial [Eschrichtius robustus]